MSKSEEEVRQLIKLEVEAERTKGEQKLDAEVQRLNDEVEKRVAEAVRKHLQSTSIDVVKTATIHPMRVASKEPPRYTGVEIGEAGSSWLSVMDAHIQLMKSLDGTLADSLLV